MALGEFWLRRALVGTAVVDYGRNLLRSDLIAALALTALVLPQSLAIAQLAGVAAVSGVYAASAALLFYAALGTSPRTIVGPEVSVAVLASAAVSATAAGTPHAQQGGALTVMVGLLALASGVARAGFVAEFLSGPVLTGFRSGAVVLVIVSQLPVTLGLKPGSLGSGLPIVALAGNLKHMRPSALLLALAAACIVIVLRFHQSRALGPLIAVAFTTLLVAWFNLDRAAGVPVAGTPPDLSFGLPQVSSGEVASLLPAAIAVALIALTENARAARAGGAGKGLDLDQDAVAVGLCSIAAGLVHGPPLTANREQMCLARQAGARTRLVGVFSVALLIVCLVPLARFLRQVPLSVLSVIVIAAALRLLNLGELRSMLEHNSLALVMTVATLAAVLSLGLLVGALAMAVFGLVKILRKVARPHDALLRTVGSEGPLDLVVYRFDAPLFFANASHLEQRVHAAVEAAGDHARWLVLDAEAIEDLDAGAVDAVERLTGELAAREVTLVMAGVSTELRTALVRSQLIELIGVDNVHESVAAAIRSIKSPAAGLRRP
jgi:sulfate permease, SulP family